MVNRFNAWAWLREKKKATSILLASSNQSTPEFMHSAPHSALPGPILLPPRMETFVIVTHISTSSLLVLGAGSRGEWKGPFMWEGDCWVGGNWQMGGIVMMMGHRCSLPLIYWTCPAILSWKNFFLSWNVGRTVASSLQEQLAVGVRQALEGSASYVLDEDLCPSAKDRGWSRLHHEVQYQCAWIN